MRDREVSEDRIEVAIDVDAPRERVWEAWAAPEHVAEWFVDEAEGRIGETESIAWIWAQMGLTLHYGVTAVDPGASFELSTRLPEGETRTLRVTLTDAQDGTRVELVESGLSSEDPGSVRSGWQMALALLKVYVEDHFGEEVRSVLVMAETEAPADAVVTAHRTADGLRSWVVAPGGLPEEGGEVGLEIGEDVTVTGEVLCHTATESSLRWSEIEGVLELKQFSTPEGRAVGLRAFSWASPEDVDPEEIREVLGRALNRLMLSLG